MKKIVILLLIIAISLSLCACDTLSNLSSKSSSKSKLVGEWEIVDLSIEPQYNFHTSRTDKVNQIADAFPEVGTTVEFTKKKYDDGYKLISESSVTSYSVESNKKIKVGDAIGKYKLSKDTLVIEFEDIATITLEED